MIRKIGFGGGCHWCTEAVFQSLTGVTHVKQGWIGSYGENDTLSEAVIVAYDPSIILLEVLIEIHLLTHHSTSDHSMRKKYRSAVYVFDLEEENVVKSMVRKLQSKFDSKLVTKVLQFSKFKPSQEEMINYYYRNPQRPFCKKFINPKLKLLLDEFSDYAKITL